MDVARFAANVSRCHRCKHRRAQGGGSCVCVADEKLYDIQDHALSDQCPKGLFGKRDNRLRIGVELLQLRRCSQCHSLAHYASDCPVGEGFDPEEERRRMQAGGCCGQPTRPG